MNPTPRSAAAVALATMAGTVASAAPAGTQEEPVYYCYTEAITVEEAEAGVTNEIFCSEDPDEVPQARLATVAVVYDGFNGGGSSLVIGGDCSRVVNFASTEYWNNRISSTDLYSCNGTKHWTGANLTGSSETFSGGGYHNMGGTLNNMTSSIEYGP